MKTEYINRFQRNMSEDWADGMINKNNAKSDKILSLESLLSQKEQEIKELKAAHYLQLQNPVKDKEISQLQSTIKQKDEELAELKEKEIGFIKAFENIENDIISFEDDWRISPIGAFKAVFKKSFDFKR